MLLHIFFLLIYDLEFIFIWVLEGSWEIQLVCLEVSGVQTKIMKKTVLYQLETDFFPPVYKKNHQNPKSLMFFFFFKS